MKSLASQSLEQQINEARRTISSDGYPMSIGELTSIYKQGELIIRPAFQRFFRWTIEQKSRLIESILLGIPLPSIFVSQTSDGKWELVDGLQRVSTILELQGELLGADGHKLPMLALSETKYLPALKGKLWEAEESAVSFTDAQRIDVKRSKVDIKIIKRESSPETKFDLFQRLNSYGTALNAQEMRSALLVAVSVEFFEFVEELSRYEDFVQTVGLSERLIEERYDLELVLRFLILHRRTEELLVQSRLRDFPRVLDDESVALASAGESVWRSLGRTFTTTFSFIANNGGGDIFRKWDPFKQEFRGSFLTTSFEVFALGAGFHFSNGRKPRMDLLEAVREFWSRPVMQSGFSTGRSTEARLADFVPLGREILS